MSKWVRIRDYFFDVLAPLWVIFWIGFLMGRSFDAYQCASGGELMWQGIKYICMEIGK